MSVQTITVDACLPPPGFNLRISYAAALSRFTPAEWADIDLFSMFRLDEPDEIGLARAQVRTFTTNLAACASTYVSLDDQRVHAILAGSVAPGLLGEGLAAEIQGPDRAPHELPGVLAMTPTHAPPTNPPNAGFFTPGEVHAAHHLH